MNELPEELLRQLVDLIDQLRLESSGLVQEPGDLQGWYNRGYANGMVRALEALGQADILGERVCDSDELMRAQVSMPWGKAYRHGEEVGRRETYQIIGKPTL